jgi:hypothetical protein
MERKGVKIYQELALPQRTRAKFYDAREAEFQASIRQAKLDKLLGVQQKYFPDSSSAHQTSS